ncbi:histone chaperone [Malassezia equina]|uniref:Histone chaperone n=1 Tax=Malassezia equina TaxID=1381935 RepID=A0AAF0EB60_9BASI|nr:histone chaperone [Malassezia equina]
MDIGKKKDSDLTAPTPQNTPLSNAPIERQPLARPAVSTIGEEEEGAADASAAAVAGLPNAALTGMIQDRLSTLVGRSSGYIESLPDEVRRRVEGLKGLNVEHQKLEAEFQRELLALEKAFAERYEPLYARRREIVLGAVEPTAAEVEAGEAVDPVDDEDEDEDDEEDEAPREKARSLANISIKTDAPKGVPEFWLTALKNHVALSELITERDEGALRHLTDVRLRYLDSNNDAAPGQAQQGFQLLFVFAKNEYFTNEVLTKTYFYQDQVGFSGDLVYDHAEGTEISWTSAENDLTHRVETKKQRNKNTNETRTVKRLVPTDSFFHFFSPPVPPSDDDDADEEELDALEERLELDYQVGEDLKDRIIPHAIDFFTGKALQVENADEWDDEDALDEYDDDDDDEDDDDAPPARQDPQECKQQ